LSYVEGTELLASGAGAYGFANGRIWVGPQTAEGFMDRAERCEFPVVETISPQATQLQILMRSLVGAFMGTGLDRSWFVKRFGKDAVETFPIVFAGLQQKGLVTIEPDCVLLTDRGLLAQDEVLADLHDSAFAWRWEGK